MAQDSSLSWPQVVIIVLVSLNLVATVFVVLAWRSYCIYKRQEYFQQRGSVCILVILSSITISQCINVPTLMLAEYELLPTKWNFYFDMWETFDFNLLIGIQTIYCLRYYLLFYRLSMHQAISNESWRNSIAGQEDYLANNFFIVHKNTLGSSIWLFKIVFVIWFIYSVIVISGKYELEHGLFVNAQLFESVFLTTVFLLEWIIILIIWKKFPRINDNFYIRNELKLTLLFVIFLILYSTVVMPIVYVLCTSLNISLQLLDIFGKITHLVFFYGSVYILIFYVINVNTNATRYYSSSKCRCCVKICSCVFRDIMTSLNSRMLELEASADRDRLSSNSMGHYRIHDILGNKECYQLYINHLASQFATENLLFITEYFQLKNSLMLTEEQLEKLDLSGFSSANVTIANEIPKTKYIFNENNRNDERLLMEYLTNLYKKYIATGCHLEINVSHSQRENCKYIMQQFEKLLNDEINAVISLSSSLSSKDIDTKQVAIASSSGTPTAENAPKSMGIDLDPHLENGNGNDLETDTETEMEIGDTIVVVTNTIDKTFSLHLKKNMLDLPNNNHNNNASLTDMELILKSCLPYFEECAVELYSLLKQSFAKFQVSPVFDQVRSILDAAN